MIEVIYKEEKKEDGTQIDFMAPRNIRQIGTPEEHYKIYMEDYVCTFLERMTLDNKNIVVILLGRVSWKDETTYVFVEGALSIKNTEFTSEHPAFAEETWTDIKKEKEQYFPEKEIVGWFAAEESLSLEKTDVFLKPHVQYFAGEKILFLKDLTEKEEAVFRYENGFLIKQSGYYIFFEKNQEMQNYMLEQHIEKGNFEKEPVSDNAVKNMRKIIRAKKKAKEEGADLFSYIATACLFLAIVSVGLNVYKSWESRIEERQEYTSVTATIDAEGEDKFGNTETYFEEENTTDTEPGEALYGDSSVTDLEKDLEEQPVTGNEENADIITSSDEMTDVEQKERKTLDEKEKTQLEQTEETLAGIQENISSTYVIRPGDTLYQISLMKYGNMDMVEEICELNHMEKDDVIYPGQIIELP